MRAHDSPDATAADGDRAQALHAHGLPPRPRAAKIPTAVHAETPWNARPQRSFARADRRRPRDETSQPTIRLSADRQQLALAFAIEINKDTVRRVLAKRYRPDPSGPSWLTFLAHSKDSLWSVDFFRCESLILTTHWVMVVMDQFTRRIVGFSVRPGVLDGLAVCRMFNDVLGRSESIPQSLSSDHDPLFLFHRWRANLRILQIREIKTVPYVPLSHPFVERLIGTIRREFLDQVPFWTSTDLERKLSDFMRYYNRERTHRALGGKAPAPSARAVADIRSVTWQSHCRGLYQLPFAA